MNARILAQIQRSGRVVQTNGKKSLVRGVGKTRDGHHGHVILDRHVPVTDTSRNRHVAVTERIWRESKIFIVNIL